MVPTWRTAMTSTVEDEAGQAVDVGDHARHQLGGVQRGEEGQRHALDVACTARAGCGR